MGKPTRMSELFTSSSGKPTNTAIATGTPPYSSEGPTIPTIGPLPDHKSSHDPEKTLRADKSSRKRKAQAQAPDQPAAKRGPQPRPPHTLHPALYTPWTLLPSDVSKRLETQTRLRTGTHNANIVSVVFSKNQNVKAGINKLKTYLGAYKDSRSSIEIPNALSQDDCLIAVSAQGQGAGKLVGIVDMTRRIVGAGAAGAETQTWYMYMMLTSVDVDLTARANQSREKGGVQSAEDDDEEEAFEPVKARKKEPVEAQHKVKKVPVLTVWMTKVKIPAFAKEFGEQVFVVEKVMEEGD